MEVITTVLIRSSPVGLSIGADSDTFTSISMETISPGFMNPRSHVRSPPLADPSWMQFVGDPSVSITEALTNEVFVSNVSRTTTSFATNPERFDAITV